MHDPEQNSSAASTMNFKELNDLLIDARTGSRAAECHGFLCGYLCVNDDLQEDTYRKYLLADSTDAAMTVTCCERFASLASEIAATISSSDYTLKLLLPDDSSPLPERGAALIEWCEGFLSGLGIAGIADTDLLSMECRELIQDLHKICRLDVADMPSREGDDEEAALMELTEYVRMGAILLHDEMHHHRQPAIRAEVLH